jgi:hypothetical protein
MSSKISFNKSQRDVLSLGDKSWDKLWSELLSVDLETPVQNQSTSLASPDETGASLSNVEGDIESWAAHSLQQLHDSSPPHHQPTPNGTSTGDFVSGDNEIICYGMVSTFTPPCWGDISMLGLVDLFSYLYLDLSYISQSQGRHVGG